MSLSSRSEHRGSRCSYCFALPLAPWQDEFFKAHGLVRDHEGYARLGERVAARRMECGAERGISISELKSGVAPCFNCAEATDPDAVHIVYMVCFPQLSARKVGITSTEVRHDRIASHLARGGIPLDQHEVPNREAARTLEDLVLCAVREFPSGCTARDFPQGGFTETWSDDGPDTDLGNVIGKPLNLNV